jgi:predicted dehydrogenase
VIEAHSFLRSIATGSPFGATIEDAARAAELVAAMAESAKERRWVQV